MKWNLAEVMNDPLHNKDYYFVRWPVECARYAALLLEQSEVNQSVRTIHTHCLSHFVYLLSVSREPATSLRIAGECQGF